MKLLRPEQAAPLATLAPSLLRQYHRQYVPSTGTLGGCLLVLALQAEGLELPLPNASVAIELAGASTSAYSLATALRKGEQLWQVRREGRGGKWGGFWVVLIALLGTCRALWQVRFRLSVERCWACGLLW